MPLFNHMCVTYKEEDRKSFSMFSQIVSNLSTVRSKKPLVIVRHHVVQTITFQASVQLTILSFSILLP